MNLNSKLANILHCKFNEDLLGHFYIIEPNTNDLDNNSLNWLTELLSQFTKLQSPMNHQDILFFSPINDKETYTKEQFIQIQEFLNYKAYVLQRKFIVISHGDKLSDIQLNKLLKTFEEPPVKTTIFLINRTKKTLLPTVNSRAAVIRPVFFHVDNNKTDDNLDKYFDLDFSDFHKKILAKSFSTQYLLNWLMKEAIQSHCQFEEASFLLEQGKKIEEDILYNNSMQSILLKLHELYSRFSKKAFID